MQYRMSAYDITITEIGWQEWEGLCEAAENGYFCSSLVYGNACLLHCFKAYACVHCPHQDQFSNRIPPLIFAVHFHSCVAGYAHSIIPAFVLPRVGGHVLIRHDQSSDTMNNIIPTDKAENAPCRCKE